MEMPKEVRVERCLRWLLVTLKMKQEFLLEIVGSGDNNCGG